MDTRKNINIVSIEKILNYVLLISALILCILEVVVILRIRHFSFQYGYIKDYEISQEKINELQEEKREIEVLLHTQDSEIKELTEHYKVLEVVQKENLFEEQIRQSYIDREEAAAEAQVVVMSALGEMNLVTLETADLDKDTIHGIVDGVVGNEILSSGIKSAIDAASQELSLESIIQGAREGAAEGIQGYVEGKAQGYVADYIGADIFSVADFVNELINADDTPAVLANGIAQNQRTAADDLLYFFKSEEANAGTIQKAAQNLYKLKLLEEEAAKITGNSVEGNKDILYDQLIQLSQQYGISNYRILKYAEQGGRLSNEKNKMDILEIDAVGNVWGFCGSACRFSSDAKCP